MSVHFGDEDPPKITKESVQKLRGPDLDYTKPKPFPMDLLQPGTGKEYTEHTYTRAQYDKLLCSTCRKVGFLERVWKKIKGMKW